MADRVRDVSSPVWAVASYFNPVGYRSRRENYRVFRRNLELPLLTVEWSPTGRFELGPGDAEVLLQLDGGDVMWQKERLLNIGIGRLPEHCTHVAWLDCDIVFERRGLADAIVQALERDRLVQLYDRVTYLGPAAHRDAERGDGGSGPLGAVRFERAGGVAVSWAGPGRRGQRVASESVEDFRGMPSIGFAWAARRSLLESHPLFDVWIVGGGDSAYFFAAAGAPEAVVENHRLAEGHRAHYLERARGLSDAVAGSLGYLEGRICTLWHGEVEHRRYRSRHGMLTDHRFDPVVFLRESESGVWRWSRAATGLPEAVRDYFAARAEDGAS